MFAFILLYLRFKIDEICQNKKITVQMQYY